MPELMQCQNWSNGGSGECMKETKVSPKLISGIMFLFGKNEDLFINLLSMALLPKL